MHTEQEAICPWGKRSTSVKESKDVTQACHSLFECATKLFSTDLLDIRKRKRANVPLCPSRLPKVDPPCLFWAYPDIILKPLAVTIEVPCFGSLWRPWRNKGMVWGHRSVPAEGNVSPPLHPLRLLLQTALVQQRNHGIRISSLWVYPLFKMLVPSGTTMLKLLWELLQW